MELAPTRWLGYKKELTLFCNARLLSCPRVARNDDDDEKSKSAGTCFLKFDRSRLAITRGWCPVVPVKRGQAPGMTIITSSG